MSCNSYLKYISSFYFPLTEKGSIKYRVLTILVTEEINKKTKFHIRKPGSILENTKNLTKFSRIILFFFITLFCLTDFFTFLDSQKKCTSPIIYAF